MRHHSWGKLRVQSDLQDNIFTWIPAGIPKCLPSGIPIGISSKIFIGIFNWIRTEIPIRIPIEFFSESCRDSYRDLWWDSREHIHRHSNRNSYRDSHRDFRLKVSPFKVGWPLDASQRFVNIFDRLPGTSRVIDSLHETQGHFWLRNQGQLFSYMFGETWLGGGQGNPPTRDNCSPYKQPLKKVLLTSVTEWIPARNAISWATVRVFQVFTKTCQKQPRECKDSNWRTN